MSESSCLSPQTGSISESESPASTQVESGAWLAAAAAGRALGLTHPCELVRVAQCVVFRCGPVALRVSQAKHLDQTGLVALTRALRGAGIPAVEAVGDLIYDADWQVSVWEWAAHDGAQGLETEAFHTLGVALRTLHDLREPALSVAGLEWPAGPAALREPWLLLEDLLASARGTGALDDVAYGVLSTQIEQLGAWRTAWTTGPQVPCHGDLHPGNLRWHAGRLVILDWDAAGWGPAGWDHAALVPWESRWGGAPGSYEAFAAGYGVDLRREPGMQVLVQVRLLVATLNLLTDPKLRSIGVERLRYWLTEDTAKWRPQ